MKTVLNTAIVFFGLWAFLLLGWGSNAQLLGYGFDDQNLSLWKYSASLNMLPFRDVFYPYGLLTYFQETIVPLKVIYLALPAAYLTIVHLWLRQHKPTWLAKTILLFFLIFIIRFTGFETFVRYGGPLAFGLLASSYSIHQSQAFFLGIGAGLLFAGFFDQGLYASMMVFLGIGLNVVSHEISLRKLPLLITSLSLGILLGILPFLAFIYKYLLWSDLVQFLGYLRDVTSFAKTPFTPFAASSDNLFTFGALFLSLNWLCFNLILKKKSVTNLDKGMMVTLALLVLLEQKSFIRSMDRQLTFLGFTAYEFLALSFARRLQLPTGLSMLALSTVIMILAFFTIHPVGEGKKPSPLPRYQEVVAQLKTLPEFNGKVFSFPGDPLFYVYTGQRPPFYFTAYEATPKYAQERQIEYLKENRICFVVINQDIPAIQDGVPNEVRNQILVEYLNSHYAFARSVGTFMILKSRLGCEQ